jgi:hypothetical protein
MKTQNIDISKETIAHFCQHWHITKLSLFGSVLRDGFHPDSDIDVIEVTHMARRIAAIFIKW